jgi:hypothetical protein
VSESPAPAWAEALGGGSQGLRVAGGYLFAVPQSRSKQRAGPVDAHRLVLLDDDLRLVSASPQFTFAEAATERCAGLARHGEDLLLSIGIAEETAALVLISEEEAIGLLKPAR